MNPPVVQRYRLLLTPDLVNFAFAGEAEIYLKAAAPVAEIDLNALDLEVQRCVWVDGGMSHECAFDVEPERETLTVRLPEARSGEITLRITYRGQINDRMVGFYRSRYTGRQGSGVIAVTQFQESDARRAFPCIDHPEAKAVFDLTLVIDEGLTAIGNQAMATQAAMPDGRQRIAFCSTPRMSTYLVFFGIGPFDLTTDREDRRVRIATLPGHEDRGGFGLTLARKALAHCEQYFGIPYPLDKLDLIAVPDFAFGAMENWGAITFRENLLLHDPRTTSKLAEMRIAEVIAHEIVHQWFGNLATPSDWKYLWLNESFATYEAYRIIDDLQPEWEVWGHFVQSHSAVALERDALRATPAIEIPGGDHVVINTGTAPIIYSKGGSLLRQIEDDIGPEDFRRGMHRYLTDHAYRCAASHHLWEAFEASTARPVSKMIQCWVSQPGHPMVTVSREGDDLLLTQRRFTYLPVETDQRWPIPLSVRIFEAGGAERRLEHRFFGQADRMRLPAGTLAFKLNDGHKGFYRIQYPEWEDLERLSSMVVSGRLSPADRWGLQDDLFAMVRAGRIGLGAYLKWLTHYRDETALLPLLGIVANLKQALLATTGARRQAVADTAGRAAVRVLGRLQMEPVPGETVAAALLREQMIWLGLISGRTDLRQRMAGVVEKVLTGAAIHPDLIQSSLQTAAFCAGPRALDALVRRLENTDSEHERLAVLGAMGAFGDWSSAKAAFEIVLARVPERNRFVPLVAAAANPILTVDLWPWFVENHARLETMHPLLYERILAAVTAVSGLACPEAVRDFSRRYAEERPALAAVIEMGLERLAINERMAADETLD